MKIQYYAIILFALLISSCKKDPIIPKRSEKQITSFRFTSLNPEVIGVIDERTKEIRVTFPYGTSINSLSPAIYVSDGAIVKRPESQDFSKTLTYTIIAEDGSKQDYHVISTVGEQEFKLDTYYGSGELEVGESHLLINGQGFGNDETKVKVTFINELTSAKTNIYNFFGFSNSLINLIVPQNLPYGNYTVEVTVKDKSITVPKRFELVQAGPKITSISQIFINSTDAITINGKYFDMTTTSVIFKSGWQRAYTFNIGDFVTKTATKLEFSLNTLPSGDYNIELRSNGKSTFYNGVLSLDKDKPVVNSLDKDTYTAGDVMIISGIRLSKPGKIATINFNNNYDPVFTRQITSYNANGDAVFTIPSDLPKGFYFSVYIKIDDKQSIEQHLVNIQ